IGLHLPVAREIEFRRAIATGQVVKSPAARWAGTYSMMETCIPVLHDGRVIAVVTRESNLSSPRFSLGFDSWAAQVSDNLCQMISRGEYP
ncbi:histidine kinase N-terminal domain-containing protein, partial [Streptococcus anginosus]|nr:histidine kinase N-terminal domain-containing protein [Streptococcus anginosus]